MSYISQIVEYIKKAQAIATQHGYQNLLQPGLVKELIIADILGHKVHPPKHEQDAVDPNNPISRFEYLSCSEKGSFQLDRMYKDPPEARAKSLERITRNTAIYCAIFQKDDPLEVLVIYKIPVQVFLEEATRKLDKSKSAEAIHLSFSIKWCERNGEVVYRKDS